MGSRLDTYYASLIVYLSLMTQKSMALEKPLFPPNMRDENIVKAFGVLMGMKMVCIHIYAQYARYLQSQNKDHMPKVSRFCIRNRICENPVQEIFTT